MKEINKKKSVQFSDRITVILIPYEERKGEWMTRLWIDIGLKEE